MSTEVNSKEKNLHFNSDERPCRTCMDFRSWMKLNSKSKKSESTAKGEALDKFQNFNIPTDNEYGGRGTRKKTEQQRMKPLYVDPDEEEYPKLEGLAAQYGCPADSVSLGRGSWRLLHSIGAYYPDSPSADIKNDMKQFIGLFSKFYPCKPCAEDFREWLRENPPDVSSRSTLSRWFCNAHNEVNRKLEKPEFNCDLIDQRWLNGWKDGSCD